MKIKFQDFRQITRSRSRAAPISSHQELRAASLDLVRSIYPPEKGIRLVGVTVSNFEEADGDSASLPLFGAGGAAAG